MAANATQREEEKTRVGFSKRAQQEALLTKAQQQQAIVDQLVESEVKQRAQSALDKQRQSLDKADAIQKEIRDRKSKKGKDEEEASYPLTSIGTNPMVIDPTTY